jgi:hypothetical protein
VERPIHLQLQHCPVRHWPVGASASLFWQRSFFADRAPAKYLLQPGFSAVQIGTCKSRGWINFDLLWSLVLVVAGIVLLVQAVF